MIVSLLNLIFRLASGDFIYKSIINKDYLLCSILMISLCMDIFMHITFTFTEFFFVGFCMLYISSFSLFFTFKNYLYIFSFFYNFSSFLQLIFGSHYGHFFEMEKYLNTMTDCKDTMTECYICLETNLEKKNLKLLYCSHPFHPKCLVLWFQKQSYTRINHYKCPVCNSSIYENDKETLLL